MKTDMNKTAMGDLKKLGFEEVEDQAPKSLIVSFFGFEGTGKTSTALTFPRPIAVINFDIGLLRARKPKGMGGDVLTKTFLMSPAIVCDPQKCKELCAEFLSTVDTILAKKMVKTLVIDTATSAWNLFLLDAWGKSDQLMPWQYTKPNAKWVGFIRNMRDSGVNVAMIHRAKYEYIEVLNSKGLVVINRDTGKPETIKTDKVVSQGQNQTGYEVDIEVGMYSLTGTAVDRKTGAEKARKGVGMEVVMCKYNKAAEGARFESEIGKVDLCNFDNLAEACVEGWDG